MISCGFSPTLSFVQHTPLTLLYLLTNVMQNMTQTMFGPGPAMGGTNGFVQGAELCNTCSSRAEPGSKLLKCSRCRNAFYCNKECQQADWCQHSKSCIKLKGTGKARKGPMDCGGH